MLTQEHELNEAAYRQLDELIKHRYRYGHYVGIAGGEIVGDAGDFMTLHKVLKAEGRDPRNVLIVQAGHVYPRKATILTIGWPMTTLPHEQRHPCEGKQRQGRPLGFCSSCSNEWPPNRYNQKW